MFGGIEFVRFHRDDGPLGATRFEQITDTQHDVIALLEHDTMVGGQVGFTFDAVDQQCVNVGFIGDAKFSVGRKRRTSQADDARRLNRANNFFRGSAFWEAGSAFVDLLG